MPHRPESFEFVEQKIATETIRDKRVEAAEQNLWNAYDQYDWQAVSKLFAEAVENRYYKDFSQIAKDNILWFLGTITPWLKAVETKDKERLFALYAEARYTGKDKRLPIEIIAKAVSFYPDIENDYLAWEARVKATQSQASSS